ncbi:hypothetical protein FKV61_19615, partial [Salmonella enterica]|nr:hypothetical protein [Salmonella enterica]
FKTITSDYYQADLFSVFIEGIRDSIRAWFELDYLADFVFSCGISHWGTTRQPRKILYKVLHINPLRRFFKVREMSMSKNNQL